MKKKIPLIVIVFLVLLGGAFFYLKFRKLDDFNPLIKEKIQTLVYEGSGGIYRIEFDSLHADVVNSTLVLRNIHLIPDTILVAKLDSAGKRPADIFSIFLESITIDGINIDDFSKNKKIDLSVITISDPKVEVFHKRNSSDDKEKDTASIQTVYQRISKNLTRFSLKSLRINNMTVIHRTFVNNHKEKNSTFNKVNMEFDDLLIDSLTQYDSTRFLYAKNAIISVGKLKFPTSDSLSYIGMDSISINALQKNLTVYSFTILPRDSKNTFAKKVSYAKERYNASFKEVLFKKIDWWSIVSNEGFSAQEAFIKNGKLEVFKDRNLPVFPGSKKGKYPQQLVIKIPFPLEIDTLRITDLDVTYEEQNPNSDLRGKIMFNNIHGSATNVTNNKNKIAADHFMKVTADCNVMNGGPLHAFFNFDLSKAAEGVFSVKAEFGQLDPEKINQVFEPLALFKMENGKINGLSIDFNGNNYSCSGTVKFLYEDLKVDIFKKGNDNGQQKKRGVVSFVANTFLLKKSNPDKDGKTRIVTASFKRDLHKSFFNLILKTMLDGILKTVGK